MLYMKVYIWHCDLVAFHVIQVNTYYYYEQVSCMIRLAPPARAQLPSSWPTAKKAWASLAWTVPVSGSS